MPSSSTSALRSAAPPGRIVRRSRRTVEPLYTMADAERTLPLFRPVSYHEPFHLTDTSELRGLRCRPHPGLVQHLLQDDVRGRRAASPHLFRRCGPSQPADHPRSRDDAARRLPHHGEHLRRPPAQARRARGQQAGRCGEPDRAPRRTHHRSRLRRGAHAATGAAAAPAFQREAHSQHPDFCG